MREKAKSMKKKRRNAHVPHRKIRMSDKGEIIKKTQRKNQSGRASFGGGGPRNALPPKGVRAGEKNVTKGGLIGERGDSMVNFCCYYSEGPEEGILAR